MAWGTSAIYTPPNLTPAPAVKPVANQNTQRLQTGGWFGDAQGKFYGGGITDVGSGGGGGAGSAPGTSNPQPAFSPYSIINGGIFRTGGLPPQTANNPVANQNQGQNSLAAMLARFYAMMQKQNTVNTLTPSQQAYNAVNGPNAVRYVSTPGYGNVYQPEGTPNRTT